MYHLNHFDQPSVFWLNMLATVANTGVKKQSKRRLWGFDLYCIRNSKILCLLFTKDSQLYLMVQIFAGRQEERMFNTPTVKAAYVLCVSGFVYFCIRPSNCQWWLKSRGLVSFCEWWRVCLGFDASETIVCSRVSTCSCTVLFRFSNIFNWRC